MQQRSMVWCAMCVIVLWGGVAAAAPVYQFVFDQANYEVNPGGTVNVGVYLKETVGSGTSVLDPATGVGLFSLGGKVAFDDPPQPTQPARVLATSDITPNSLFDDAAFLTKEVAGTYARLAENTVSVIDFVHGTQTGPGTYEVLVGTFAFTAGALPGEVTHIRATRYGTIEGDIVWTGNGDALDDSLIVNGTATITTIPEPSALVLGGLAILSLLAFRCWTARRGRVSSLAA